MHICKNVPQRKSSQFFCFFLFDASPVHKPPKSRAGYPLRPEGGVAGGLAARNVYARLATYGDGRVMNWLLAGKA